MFSTHLILSANPNTARPNTNNGVVAISDALLSLMMFPVLRIPGTTISTPYLCCCWRGGHRPLSN